MQVSNDASTRSSYTFHIQSEGPQLDVLITRALLGLSALACILFGNQPYRFVDYFIALVLVVVAILLKKLIQQFQLGRIVIIGLAAILLFISTGSFIFAAILVLYGFAVKFLYPKNVVEVADSGVLFNRVLGNSHAAWTEINNLVLKDHLLTIDFKNNKLLQLTTDPRDTEIDEAAFNRFCSRFLHPAQV